MLYIHSWNVCHKNKTEQFELCEYQNVKNRQQKIIWSWPSLKSCTPHVALIPIILVNLKEKMVGSILISWIILVSTAKANIREGYKMYDFATWCRSDGGKNTIKLKTGSAILTLDEKNPVTSNILKNKDISCHLELETHNTDYGFHIFFDEMDLDVKENSVLGGPKPTTCQDYVQFGRDVLYFTTSKSRKFCGFRERLFYHNATQADYARALTQGNRLFIESADHEMDVWLKVKSTRYRPITRKRHLRLIVTVFKKGCQSNDMYWRKCDNTNYCVRKGHFCDNYANCGWPDGEIASDETQKLCSNVWKNNSESSQQTGDIFTTPNVPAIIMVAVGIAAALVLLFVIIAFAVRKLRKRQQKDNISGRSSNSSGSGNVQGRSNRRTMPEHRICSAIERDTLPEEPLTVSNRERRRLSYVENDVTPPLLHHTDPGGGLPSAPPSYEEVVHRPYVPSAPMPDRSDPPPYSSTVL